MHRFLDLSDDLSLVLDAAGVGAWRWNPEDNKVEWTAAAERLHGLEPGTFPGTFDAYASNIHPDDVDEVLALVDRMAARGGDYSVRYRVALQDGSVRWLEGQGRIVLGPTGIPTAGLGIVYDVSDRVGLEAERNRLRMMEQQARDVSEQWRGDVEFLIEASDVLNASLNLERVAARLAGLLVPNVADGCVIDVRLEAPSRAVLTAARLPEMERALVSTSTPLDGTGATRRLRLGLTPDPLTDPADLAQAIEGVSDDIHPAGEVSWLVEPLRARGTRIGTVIAWRTGREWEEPARALLTAVCRRGAVALDAAELYRERSAVAAEFYRSMNPEQIPDVPGWDLGVHYRPATELVRLSGDFFDVFELPDGSWMMAVGDVCGKGIAAAGQAGLARAALRAAGQVSMEPADALAVLNRVLLLDPGRPMLTAVLARLSSEKGFPVVEVASAGHPVPVLVKSDGTWEEIEVKGTMMGYVEFPSFVTSRLRLDRGDAVVMYTDGITESRSGDEFFRLERLAASLTEVAGLSAAAMADAATMSADVWAAGSEQDDVALLVAMATI